MRFAVISDMHFGPEGSYRGVVRKLTHNSAAFADSFVQEMNTSIHPAFVAQLGDVVQDKDPATDKNNFSAAMDTLAKLTCRVVHLVGNHDQHYLSETDLCSLTRNKSLYFSFDDQGFHFVVLYSKEFKKGNIRIFPNQVQWLEQDLEQTMLPTVVFVHHSLADQDLKGNFWFEGKPDDCLIQNRDKIRSILEKNGKVKAVINGHLHWNNKTVHNRIAYFTIQSLVENFRNDGTPSNAFAIVDLDDKKIHIRVSGNDPAEFEHSF